MMMPSAWSIVHAPPPYLGKVAQGLGANVRSQVARSRGNIDSNSFIGNVGMYHLNLFDHPLPNKSIKSAQSISLKRSINENRGEVNRNQLFGAIRFMQMATEKWGGTLWAQNEFNEFRKQEVRFLVGLSVNLRIIQTESITISSSHGPMYEYEKFDLNDEEQDRFDKRQINIRAANFLAMIIRGSKSLEIRSFIYYQPLVKDIDDYAFLYEGEISFEHTSGFEFGISYELHIDSLPAPGIKRNDDEITQYIAMSF